MPRTSARQDKHRTNAAAGKVAPRSIEFREDENEFTLDLHLHMLSASTTRVVTLSIAAAAGLVQILTIDVVRKVLSQIFGGR